MTFSLDREIRVKMFGHVSQKCGNWHNGARTSDNLVLYCTDGEINMEIEHESFHMQEGDLLLIPCGALYKPLDGGSCRYYFFHFEATELTDTNDALHYMIISPHIGLSEGFGYTCVSSYVSTVNVQQQIKNAPYYIRDIFKRAERLRPNANFSDQLLLDHLLRELLIHIGDTLCPQQNKHLKEMLDYIEHHYFENLSLSSMANRFSLSQSYIARLFKKELSCKPSEYVNRVRISVAKTMLSETDMTVTEVAEKVGYSDVYYFSKTFKRVVGSPPSAMRR